MTKQDKIYEAYPLAMASGTSVATGALLNYVRVLNEDLKDENIYAGIVLITGNVVAHEDSSAEPHSFLLPVFAEEVADKHWQLCSKPQEVELIAGDPKLFFEVFAFLEYFLVYLVTCPYRN